MISDYLVVPFGILFSLLTTIGVMGNLIVILAIAGDPKMRKSVMNILLLNLAVADASNLIVNTCEWIPKVTHNNQVSKGIEWMLPDFLCSVCRYLECVFLFSSISTQLIVCIERYIAIVHPMRARLVCSRRNGLLAVAAAWVFVCIFASPYAYYNSVKQYRPDDPGTCSNGAFRQPWFKHYKLAEFLSFYALPCFVIIAVYAKVVTVLWASNPQLSEVSQCIQKKRKNETLRTRRNVVKMLVACVGVYFVCYSPIQFIFLSKSLLQFNVPIHNDVILIFNALAMTCSASNPLLYTLFSLKFRRKIKSFLTCSSLHVVNKSSVRESRVVLYSNIMSTGESL